MLHASIIKQRALEVGFDLVGIAPPSAVKDLEFLPQWIKRGYSGEMRYLANPQREDPRRVLPSVKSILCLGLIYDTPYAYSTEMASLTGTEKESSCRYSTAGKTRSRAWISRYAWGRDYHKVMRRKLEKLRTILENSYIWAETRVYVDTGPIMERSFARLSGIGWMGKNTCIINEHEGSWIFLGVIFTNLELDLDLPAPDRCGSCTRCLEACPTGALVEPYVMDASRCIAYLNIELRGAIPEKFRTAIGNNVFGCDICQDVCPWNNRPLSAGMAPLNDDAASVPNSGARPSLRRKATSAGTEFQPMHTDAKSLQSHAEPKAEGQSAPQPSTTDTFSLFNPTLQELASIAEEDFKRVFAQSPIKRAKYRGWLRNLCVAMGNSGDRQFVPWLEAKAAHEDSVVREHAAWALRGLQGGEPESNKISSSGAQKRSDVG